MKVLITGSAGRIGRAIYIKLMKSHTVIGIDRMPCSTADIVGDIGDATLITKALSGIDAVIHTAALHAPHVGVFSQAEFQRINVDATQQLTLACINQGVKHLVFTSTTALYGHASTLEGTTAWITEKTEPRPKSVYHTSKIQAENLLAQLSLKHTFPVTVLQVSRCFPEPADLMAVYRLTRGIDARDVASAHLCAINKRPPGFQRFIISGDTPFLPSDCHRLYREANAVIVEKAPHLGRIFADKGWSLPDHLDRVYDSSHAQKYLGWTPQHGAGSVIDMLDSELAEVLPVTP